MKKAEELGVPVGPERSQLVKGQTITLKDGTVITPEMVLGEAIPGTKIVFTGDTGRTDNILPYAKNADALICEGTFLDEEREEANRFGHLTAKQAAEFAVEANVKNLLINHVSRRYRERDFVKEARSVFPDAVVVRDLDHFQIRRGKPIVKIKRERENDPL